MTRTPTSRSPFTRTTVIVALASLLSLGASQALAQTTQEVEQQAAQTTQQGAQQVEQAVQSNAAQAGQQAAQQNAPQAAQLSAIVQRAAAPVSAQQASTALSSSGMGGLLQDLLKLPDLH